MNCWERTIAEQRAVIEGLRAEIEHLRSSFGWLCFHCGERFIDREDARLHFGDDCMSDAACQIDIKAVREMERTNARFRAEDSDTDRAMYRMQADHAVALRRAEEQGYARGLHDASHIEGWQPIETAPKDGTHILVARAGEDIGSAPIEITRWLVRWSYELIPGTDFYRKVPDNFRSGWDGNGHRATHWMLPEPPK